MKRTFIQSKEFSKIWDSEGLKDDDLLALEEDILNNPKIGPVMKGTGRLRKLRYAYEGKGKSGSARICYVDFEELGIVYFITLYSKNKKENLSQEDRNNIKKAIAILESKLKEGK